MYTSDPSTDNQTGNNRSSGLSPAAQKVYPELIAAGNKMRIPRPEARGDSVVTVGNRITGKVQSPTDVIDFDITLTSAKSELVQDPQITPEKKDIRRRFMDKVRANVINNNLLNS